MMMLHDELECDVKRFICYIPSQGYIEGSYNKNWLFLSYLLNQSKCKQSGIYTDSNTVTYSIF